MSVAVVESSPTVASTSVVQTCELLLLGNANLSVDDQELATSLFDAVHEADSDNLICSNYLSQVYGLSFFFLDVKTFNNIRIVANETYAKFAANVVEAGEEHIT